MWGVIITSPNYWNVPGISMAAVAVYEQGMDALQKAMTNMHNELQMAKEDVESWRSGRSGLVWLGWRISSIVVLTQGRSWHEHNEFKVYRTNIFEFIQGPVADCLQRQGGFGEPICELCKQAGYDFAIAHYETQD